MDDLNNRIYDYLAHNSNTCPFCGNEDLDHDGGDFGSEASQEVSCPECGAVWSDIYRLEGIEVVSVGSKADPSVQPERHVLIQRWLMIQDGIKAPILDGPYESEEARIEAARAHHKESVKSYLFRLDIGLDGGAEIAEFNSMELAGE